MNIIELGKRVGVRGIYHLGLFTLQKRRANRLYHPPLYAQIETTKGCNLRCQVCGLSHYYVQGGHMRLAEFERTLDHLGGVQEVMLQGLGEPLLNPDFVDIVHTAKACGLRVETTTNGTRLTPNVASGLIEAGLDLLSISIDGTTAETYEAIRHGAQFETVISNARTFAEAKREHGAKRPKFNIGYILTRDNYQQLPELVHLASDLGVEEINVWRLQGGGTYTDIEQLSLEDVPKDKIQPILNTSYHLASDLGIALTLPTLDPVYNAPICEWPWRGVYVTWDGYVTPCCIMCYPEILNFGNILEQDIGDIWNNSAYRAFRAQLRSATPSEICRECPYRLPWMAKLKHRPDAEILLRVEAAD